MAPASPFVGRPALLRSHCGRGPSIPCGAPPRTRADTRPPLGNSQVKAGEGHRPAALLGPASSAPGVAEGGGGKWQGVHGSLQQVSLRRDTLGVAGCPPAAARAQRRGCERRRSPRRRRLALYGEQSTFWFHHLVMERLRLLCAYSASTSTASRTKTRGAGSSTSWSATSGMSFSFRRPTTAALRKEQHGRRRGQTGSAATGAGPISGATTRVSPAA